MLKITKTNKITSVEMSPNILDAAETEIINHAISVFSFLIPFNSSVNADHFNRLIKMYCSPQAKIKCVSGVLSRLDDK